MEINPAIFKAYDIRGKYPEEINEKTAYGIGRAFVEFLEEEGGKICSSLKIVIGRDVRLSSPALAKALIKGLLEGGANVTDIGLASTPMVYFGTISYSFDGGISVTGSHLSKNYNGFKFVKKNSVPVSEESGIIEIKNLATRGEFKECPPGKLAKKDILEDYVNHSLLFKKRDVKKLKVVVDAGNSLGGLLMSNFFKKIGCELVPLYFAMDGNFPNHSPDPLRPENLVDLQKKILETKADLGIALDGDADRVFFVDEKGELIGADIITALIARDILKENPGEKILYDLRSSRIVQEEIVKNGGIPIVSRVGHSVIKEKMRKEDIFFGGELTGHYFLKENNFMEPPLIVVIKIFEILSDSDTSLSVMVSPLKKYFLSGEMNFHIKDKKGKIEEIKKKYNNAKKIYQLDGLSIEYDNWWFNVRPSNTENFLRLNLEANSKELMEEKKKELAALIED